MEGILAESCVRGFQRFGFAVGFDFHGTSDSGSLLTVRLCVGLPVVNKVVGIEWFRFRVRGCLGSIGGFPEGCSNRLNFVLFDFAYR